MNDLEHNEHGLEEEEEMDDADASIDESMLDEIGSDTDDADAETEGFGHIDETGEEDEDEEDEEDAADEDGSLENDAEDVDFDTFDDVDEL